MIRIDNNLKNPTFSILWTLTLIILNLSPNISVAQFPISYINYNYHIMLYFEGHPEYEAIESMMYKNIDNQLIIRTILTYHNQTQIDFINDEETFMKMKQSSGLRNICYTNTAYEIKEDINKPNFKIAFINPLTNEKITYKVSCAGKLSNKYGKLTDPGNHSLSTSFPIMYRDRSTLANKKSYISINDIIYKVPIEVNKSPFFKGLKGYVSDGFQMVAIRAGESKLDTQTFYHSRTFNYQPSAGSLLNNHDFYIELSHPINSGNCSGTFMFYFMNDKEKSTISGEFTKIKNQIRLKPSSPLWAIKRNITLDIIPFENKIVTTINNK